MTPNELGSLIWHLANAVTAFAAVQGLVFAYACAKKEVADVLNRRALKRAIALMVGVIAIGQCLAVWWCGHKLCLLDAPHCALHNEATLGRVGCIVGLAVFSIVILYARQLFAHKPFDD